MDRLANVRCQVVSANGSHFRFLLALLAHHRQRNLAADLLQELAQLSHSGLARVVLDHLVKRGLREVEVLGAYAAGLDGVGDEVLARDSALLLEHVPRDADDLHAIHQRPWNGVEHVGGAHEEHPRQVHGHVKVVVAEAVVLLGVQDLQEGRGGVPAVIATQLVDLVDQHHRVRALGDLQALDELPGHGAHVRAPVAAQLRHVVQASHGEAEELAVQRARDALADGGLPDARRAHYAHDLALHFLLQETHRDVLHDPLFHVLEAVVILVQDGLRLRYVLVLFGELPPRQAREPLQVRAADVELRR
mmetsp:Transcript_76392/g.206414  ORF Transcript_76392/g.206414 Transcript_76392/m.206414 type:complete len:305 (+) Transcript_76392:948-1862(+)